jgi:menaquinone-dependent protoporphyrinogen oxidase
MKVLIVYGTTEGQTRKISEFLKEEIGNAGYEVELADATMNPPNPNDYNAVIVAGSLHAGNYQTSIQHYVKDHHDIINEKRSIFISVSLIAATKDQESWRELEEHTEKFLNLTGWHPDHVEQVAGALLYTKYDFFKRFLMRMISKRSGGDVDTTRDYEYTDWDQVKDIEKKLK